MNFIKSYDPTKWFFKKGWMENNCHIEHPRENMSEYVNTRVTLEYYFENKMPLAHNHWVGLWRVTHPNGAYQQYLVSVAAYGLDQAIPAITKAVAKELWEYDFNWENNLVVPPITKDSYEPPEEY